MKSAYNAAKMATTPAQNVAIFAKCTVLAPSYFSSSPKISDVILAAAQLRCVSAHDIQAAKTLSAKIMPHTGGILFKISHTSAWSPAVCVYKSEATPIVIIKNTSKMFKKNVTPYAFRAAATSFAANARFQKMGFDTAPTSPVIKLVAIATGFCVNKSHFEGSISHMRSPSCAGLKLNKLKPNTITITAKTIWMVPCTASA